jgi:hypothetical protein
MDDNRHPGSRMHASSYGKGSVRVKRASTIRSPLFFLTRKFEATVTVIGGAMLVLWRFVQHTAYMTVQYDIVFIKERAGLVAGRSDH